MEERPDGGGVAMEGDDDGRRGSEEGCESSGVECVGVGTFGLYIEAGSSDTAN